MTLKALVIEDDESTLELMRLNLADWGFDVSTSGYGNTALDMLGGNDFDIVLTDLNLPDMNGIEMVRKAKEVSPDTEIIMITGFGSTELAIEATKAGAFHFIEKPVSFDELHLLIDKAVERKQQAKEIRELRGRLTSRSSYEGIIGSSRAMQAIYEIIDSVADSDANILILGESGTGKEVIANAIHYKSGRSKKPFVKVNCSALPKDLIESQLFGHTRGAFTGATSDRSGFIAQASGGSLLLDEIAEMPSDLQPKLLRVLQERVFYRVGGDSPQQADFRLICSTNRDPFEALADGSLREDLYYRINTIEIRIPPLRERIEDVPALADHFLEGYAERYRRGAMKFSERAFGQMLGYHWRGNVRELQNSVERAVLLAKGDTIESLGVSLQADSNAEGSSRTAAFNLLAASPAQSSAANGDSAFFEEIGRIVVEHITTADEGGDGRDVFDKIEESVVRAALARTEGNKQAAANLLGLYRPRLYGMIRRHRLGDDKNF